MGASMSSARRVAGAGDRHHSSDSSADEEAAPVVRRIPSLRYLKKRRGSVSGKEGL